MTIAIGIDLGTTNSLAAYSENQKVTVLADENGKKIIPSVLAITKNNEFLVGSKAKAMRGNNDVVIVSSIKRLMGKSARDATNTPHLEQFIDKNHLDSVTLNIYGKELTPIEVSAEILKRLKSIAKSDEVEAVITVPAYFDESQRQATKQAAKLAGLKVLRIINEPTAAALAYGLNKSEEGVYVIYDFGGGTFDVSVLRMQKGIFQVLATGGDTSLGGDDIDILLAQALVRLSSRRKPRSRTLEQHDQYDIDKNYNNLDPGFRRDDKSWDFRELINQACEVKERLSAESEVKIRVGDNVVAFSRAELNELIEPLVMKTIAITKEAIKDQKDICGVVLVGGSTRIPLVKDSIRKIISDKIYDDFNPDEIVAIGAALQAENLTKGSNNLLLDVTPLSLGIELLGGINEKIIHRNTLIPVLASHEFTTHQDGQTGIKIHVVQGEREMAKDCRSLAHLEVKDIPPMKAGIARVKISFIIDADGLLTVEAQEQTTGAAQRVEIIASHGLNSDKVENMLRDAVQYSKEDEEAKLTVESIIHAEEIVFKIEQAMTEDPELLSHKDNQSLKKQISKIKRHIKAKDRQLIDTAVIYLEQISHDFIERKIDKYINHALRGTKISGY